MNCSICEQPKADLKINGHDYHRQCYMDEFGVPKEQVERLVGQDSSRIRKARMTLLMNEGQKETHDAFERSWYGQRQHIIASSPAIDDPIDVRRKLRRKIRNKDRFRKRGEWRELLGSMRKYTGVQEGCHRLNQNNRD